MSKSIYDLIVVDDADDKGVVILEDIKPILDIYNELRDSNVVHLLSYAGGIKLSHVLLKLSQAMETQRLAEEGEDEEMVNALDDVLTEEERSFIYGVYLLC